MVKLDHDTMCFVSRSNKINEKYKCHCNSANETIKLRHLSVHEVEQSTRKTARIISAKLPFSM
jgi:hypothetical protein